MEALTARRFQGVAQRRPPCAGCAQFRRAIPEYRCAWARRNCIATPALIGCVATLRIESLSAVALPDLCEKGGGERWRWFFKPKACAPCRRTGSGRRKEQCDASLQVRSTLDDHQVQGQCLRLLQTSDSSWQDERSSTPRIVRSTDDGEDCGKAASPEFSARAFDEDNNTSM